MIIAKVRELHDLLHKGLTVDLMREAENIHNMTVICQWVSLNEIEEKALEYVAERGYDPETFLVLYINPLDYDKNNPPDQSVFEQEKRRLSLLNHTQCTCSYYPNMTIEKLAKLYNQVVDMKAFL